MTKYHFVGIKGTGMSSLAQILFDLGEEVQGSDIEKTFFTQKALEEKGIPILNFDADNIKEGFTIIAGNAFPDDHEEIVRARELGLPVHRYFGFLGDFAQNFSSVAVTGTHGKTSTTGLLAHVYSGHEPSSFLIGDGTGHGEKGSKTFIYEACEYKRHFLHYEPDYSLITNIEFDHSDYYKDLDDVMSAFQELALKVKKAVIACGDDQMLQQLKTNVPIIYYGFGDDNDFQATNIMTDESGTVFDVTVRNDFYGQFKIRGFGNHNVLNALGVIAFCHYQDVPVECVRKRLAEFQGTKRRFTEKVLADQRLIDDYAHHPTEIKATIQAARAKYPERPVVAVFQPHTYTRTSTFLEEFAETLSEADQVYLCDIFGSAREQSGNLTIQDLQNKIPGAELINEDNVGILKNFANGVLLFMGAGDIQKFQAAYVNESGQDSA